jgi:hypothetical protein
VKAVHSPAEKYADELIDCHRAAYGIQILTILLPIVNCTVSALNGEDEELEQQPAEYVFVLQAAYTHLACMELAVIFSVPTS